MGENKYDTFFVFGGVYGSVEAAEYDYDAVKAVYYNTNVIDTFDAAVISKKEDGKVKIHKKHEQPTRHGGWVGAGWGLATGLAVALFPAAAIGGGLLAATTAAGAGIGALAGHMAGGMSRSDLKDLGEGLDAGQAGLVVLAASDMEAKVEEAISRAETVIKKQADVDAAELQAELDEAKAEAEADAG